jgi:hypothetical protein
MFVYVRMRDYPKTLHENVALLESMIFGTTRLFRRSSIPRQRLFNTGKRCAWTVLPDRAELVDEWAVVESVLRQSWSDPHL